MVIDGGSKAEEASPHEIRSGSDRYFPVCSGCPLTSCDRASGQEVAVRHLPRARDIAVQANPELRALRFPRKMPGIRRPATRQYVNSRRRARQTSQSRFVAQRLRRQGAGDCRDLATGWWRVLVFKPQVFLEE